MGDCRCHCALGCLRTACQSGVGRRLRPCSHAAYLLLSIEKHGENPRFEKEFSIFYDHIGPLITAVIKEKVDGSKEGTAGCPTFACPDLHWKVTVKADFAFTEKGQPVIQAFGDPQQQYGVDVTVRAQVKINFDAEHKVGR